MYTKFQRNSNIENPTEISKKDVWCSIFTEFDSWETYLIKSPTEMKQNKQTNRNQTIL